MIFPGEDGQHFLAFYQAYVLDFAPKGALEQSLVQELAHAQWSINRTRAHESSLFALGHEKHAEKFQTGGDQVIQSAFAGAIVFKIEGETLAHVGLYLQRSTRMFHTTLKALIQIQSARKAEESAEFTRAVQCASVHQQSKIPFVPSEFGFLYSLPEIAPYVKRETFLATHKQPPIRVKNAT